MFNFMDSINLKTKIVVGLGLLMVMIIALAVLGVWSVNKSNEYTEILIGTHVKQSLAAENSLNFLLQARRSEKDFLLRMDEKYVDRVNKAVDNTKAEIQIIQDVTTMGTHREEAKEALGLMEQYRKGFKSLSDSYITRGLNEKIGLQGKLRAEVHSIEKLIKDQKQNDLLVKMLMVRRHEKDYLMRLSSKYLDRIDLRIQEFNAIAKNKGFSPKTKQELKNKWQSYQKAIQAIAATDKKIKEEKASFREVVHNVEAILNKLSSEIVEETKSAQKTFFEEMALLANTPVVVAVIAVVLGVLVSLFLLRNFIDPVQFNAISMRLKGISEGDLDQEKVEVKNNDEVGQLGTTFNLMLENLRNLVENIQNSAGALASASEELGATSMQMSSNAEETSAQANSVSGAAEQVSANVQSVATGSDQMTSSIQEIAKNATEAARVTAETVTMAEDTNKTVGALGESSQEIGQVIKVITSIAEQTNLLALNATIEAARAGDAGKGFAVVANEVKELATQTAKATEDIGKLIQDIQSNTGNSVEAIAKITASIHNINEIANTIAASVEEQSATTSEIARSIAEASSGTENISKNIVGMAKAAQETSKGAGATQESASSLASMATELNAIVDDFKGKNNGR